MSLFAAWIFLRKQATKQPEKNLPVLASSISYNNSATKLAVEKAGRKKKQKEQKVNEQSSEQRLNGSCHCIDLANNCADAVKKLSWINKPRYDAKPDNVLFRTLRQTGKPNIREFLFFRWVKRATGIARRYFTNCMPYAPILSSDDLESRACIVLLEAIDEFDPEINDSFEGYLHQYIKWRIIDELRAMQDFPRKIAKNRRELKLQLNALTQKLQKKINLEDIRCHLGEEVYQKAIDKLFFCNVYNQTLSTGSNKSFSPGITNLAETVLDETPELPPSMLRDDIEKIVLRVLSDNHRSVIFQYYFMELTIPEIADNLEISTTSVCDKRQEALAILKVEITKQ